MATVNSPEAVPSAAAELPPELIPCVDDLVTEDDTPVDNIYSEKQQRLLTEPLYSSWKPDRLFVALANVGLFYAVRKPPLVPDALLSLDVETAADLKPKRNRSYFIWEFGKVARGRHRDRLQQGGGRSDGQDAQVRPDRHPLLRNL